VNFPCTNSAFTFPPGRERLRDAWLTRLGGPALDAVSVRNLAGLAPASFPRFVASPQLPSPSALSIGVDIWYSVLLKTPVLAQGTCTPQIHAHAGRTKVVEADELLV